MILGFLLTLGIGFFGGTMSQKTHTLCECVRTEYAGAYCQKIKPADFASRDYGCAAK